MFFKGILHFKSYILMKDKIVVFKYVFAKECWQKIKGAFI